MSTPGDPMGGDGQTVIIKRVKKVRGHGHHGGAWKIAYADFVTAMMAFFLMMWLLAMASDDQRRGISDYFENPLRVAASGGQSVGDQLSILQAGGEDFRFQDGEMRRGTPADPTVDAIRLARAQELAALEQLKLEFEAAMEQIPSLREFKGQLLLDLMNDGLRLQIIDQENRPMFESGSAELNPNARALLAEVAMLLERSGNRVSISGHTDAKPFAGGDAGYSNWELSNDRANAARRALVRGGLEPEKVMRVVGLASTVLLDAEDPLNAVNRRISIVVMTREAEDAITRDGGALEDDSASPELELATPEVAPATSAAAAMP